jgi:solute carrier family 36 (proton-coupled amino acid transporter)
MLWPWPPTRLSYSTFLLLSTTQTHIITTTSGFQQSGWAVAIPAMLFATYMFIYNAHRLLECWKVESDKNHAIAENLTLTARTFDLAPPQQKRSASAAAASSEPNAEWGVTQTPATTTTEPPQHRFTPTLLTYPELARRSLGRFALLVDFGIASMQFGVCLSYLIFVPQNLQQCVHYWSHRVVVVPRPVFLFCMIFIEIPLLWITDIRKLAGTNVVATLLTALGLCAVLVLAIRAATVRVVPPSSSDDLAADDGTTAAAATWTMVTNLRAAPAITDSWFIFIGTSFFMMEGSMTLLVPLQEAVYLKKDRDAFPQTNAVVTTWIVVFYIIFSIICVAGFGDGIRTALTASLTGGMAAIVQLAYSIAVIMTFPLQAFPAMQVAITSVLSKHKAARPSLERSLVASLIVIALGVVAALTLDYLGNVVSILGSLFGIPLALVYPPLMHNSMVKNSSPGRRLANHVVVFVGFVATAAASYATIANWRNNAEG